GFLHGGAELRGADALDAAVEQVAVAVGDGDRRAAPAGLAPLVDRPRRVAVVARQHVGVPGGHVAGPGAPGRDHALLQTLQAWTRKPLFLSPKSLRGQQHVPQPPKELAQGCSHARFPTDGNAIGEWSDWLKTGHVRPEGGGLMPAMGET